MSKSLNIYSNIYNFLHTNTYIYIWLFKKHVVFTERVWAETEKPSEKKITWRDKIYLQMISSITKPPRNIAQNVWH